MDETTTCIDWDNLPDVTELLEEVPRAEATLSER